MPAFNGVAWVWRAWRPRALRSATLLVVAAAGLWTSRARADERDPAASIRLECRQCFVDTKGNMRDSDAVYDEWFGAEHKKPRYFLAALQELGVLAAGTAYYWIRPSLNRTDWDFPSATTRIEYLEAAFDNNKFKTNHVLHPIAGATYYAVARENDLSPWASAAYAVGASAMFEFLLEWLEKVSYNDLIFTPAAGIPAGEFAFELSQYLNSAKKGAHSAANYAFEYSLGLPGKIHGDPRGLRGPQPMPSDEHGLSSAFWHEFHLGFGMGVTAGDGESVVYERLTGEGTLIAMPGLLRPGHFAKGFAEANFNTARLRYSFGPHDLEADAAFRTTLAGYYAQDFEFDGRGLRGQAAMLGLGMGYNYHDSQAAGAIDQWSFAHLVGPNALAWVASGGLLLRVGAEAYYDFGAAYALAYPQYIRVYPVKETKSVLQEQGYQFVHGGSARAELSLAYGRVELGARRSFGRYWSIQGADRFQSAIVHEVTGTDDISETDVWLRAAAPPRLPIEARVDYNANYHINRMPPFSAQRREQRFTFSLGFRL